MPQQKQQGNKVRLTLMIDQDVIRWAKARAAYRGESLSEIVERLMLGYVDSIKGLRDDYNERVERGEVGK